MIQINKYIDSIKDCYYINEKGQIYNSETKQFVNDNNYGYMLYTTDNKRKKYSLKKIYKQCFGIPYCINDIVSFDGEEWKYIPHTDNDYLCSNLGRIISLKEYKAKLMIPSINNDGYARIQLTINGKRKDLFVHTIVASMYLIQQPLEETILKHEIHHINMNKSDNRACNLCYMRFDKHRKLHDELKKKEKKQCQKNCD